MRASNTRRGPLAHLELDQEESMTTPKPTKATATPASLPSPPSPPSPP